MVIKTMPDSGPIKISILATPDSTASTLFGLFDVLSTVGIVWEEFVTWESANPKFDVRIVAVGKEPFQCGNAMVTPHCSIYEAENTDVAIISSFAVPAQVLRKHDERELEWLTRLQSRGTVIGAGCTGVSLLAESNLINGMEATSFWAYGNLMKEHYPMVKWRTDLNICCSGSDQQFVTAGGTTSWQELALYLILRYCGVATAAQSAKFWVIPDRGESQAPYSVENMKSPHNDGVIEECQKWIGEKYNKPNPIAGMIEHTGLAHTTFVRRFKRATGDRPMDYVHMLRIEKAKEMLEGSNNSVDEIGHEIGYEDPASFRRIFKRKVSLTPSVYRRKFGYGRFDRYGVK
jgi:transcriptional regulator GlxA family with amidase domain